MSEQRTAQLFEQLAARAIPDDADLRPAVRARLASREKRPPGRRAAARLATSPGQRRLRTAVGLLVLVLALGVPLTALASRATLRDHLQRFGLVLVEPTPAPPAPTAAPAAASPVASVSDPLSLLSLAEAQQQAPYPIRTPAWLPPGLTLRGAFVGPGPSAGGGTAPTTVVLSYARIGETSGSTPAGMHIDQTNGVYDGGYAIPATAAQETSVGGHPAVYAQGAWSQDGGSPLSWNPQADSAILSWVADGFTYLVQFSGLGLTRDELIRIAESVR